MVMIMHYCKQKPDNVSNEDLNEDQVGIFGFEMISQSMNNLCYIALDRINFDPVLGLLN